MALKIYLALTSLLLPMLKASPVNLTTIDQRQTGEYNIHINLKDVKIFALLGGGLGGSEDYDYNYDYSEMTVKPSLANQTVDKPTTKPTTTLATSTSASLLTTTEKVVEITPVTPSQKPTVLANNATVSANVTEISKPVNLQASNQNINIPVKIVMTPVEIQSSSDNIHLKKPTTAATVSTPKIKQADCIEGFVKEKNGNCVSKAKKQQQTILRRLIQLSQRPRRVVTPAV